MRMREFVHFDFRFLISFFHTQKHKRNAIPLQYPPSFSFVHALLFTFAQVQNILSGSQICTLNDPPHVKK